VPLGGGATGGRTLSASQNTVEIPYQKTGVFPTPPKNGEKIRHALKYKEKLSGGGMDGK